MSSYWSIFGFSDKLNKLDGGSERTLHCKVIESHGFEKSETSVGLHYDYVWVTFNQSYNDRILENPLREKSDKNISICPYFFLFD